MSKRSSTVHTVRKRLANGEIRIYEYERRRQPKGRTAAQPGTLAEMLIGYKRSPEYAGLKANTRQAYFRYLQHLEEAWNNPVAGITRRTLLAMRDAVAAEYGPAAANGFITAASAAFKWGRDRAYVETSPLTQVARLPGGEFPAWSQDQIDYALRTFPEALKRAIILGLYSGQRRSDLITMGWSQYDGASLHLRQIKTGKPLIIPCHTVLRSHLEQWRADRRSTLILTTHRGLPWSGTHLSTAFARAVRKVGLPAQLNIHGIRKAACAALAEAGCSILEIQAVSGHASMSSLAIYVRSAEQRRLAGAAVARLEAGMVEGGGMGANPLALLVALNRGKMATTIDGEA